MYKKKIYKNYNILFKISKGNVNIYFSYIIHICIVAIKFYFSDITNYYNLKYKACTSVLYYVLNIYCIYNSYRNFFLANSYVLLTSLIYKFMYIILFRKKFASENDAHHV